MNIYTTGFPRSGTWWCTRLISAVLDSPIKTLPPDNVTVSDFCKTGEGGHIIYKTHLRVMQYDQDYHDDDSKPLFIQRDPRDVAISALYYRASLRPTAENLLGVIQTMIVKRANPPFQIYHESGVYESWVREWLEYPNAVTIKYEDLHNAPIITLNHAISDLVGYTPPIDHVRDCYNQLQFDNWKAKYPHAMRKGIAGDWRNHFNREHGKLMTEHLGLLMLDQSYIDSLDWWKELQNEIN